MTTQVNTPKKLSLRKQAALAPKFVFKVVGQNLYACDGPTFLSISYTTNIAEALVFADGFDNSKLAYYQAVADYKKLGYKMEIFYI